MSIQRARQIALLTRSLNEMSEEQREWLIEFSDNYGLPLWVRIIVGMRLRKRRKRLEARLVAVLDDTIVMIQKRLRED